MPRIVKVGQSDHRLKVQNGGNIWLDTGNRIGSVIITGNLDVKGTTTTVESTDTTIRDNILHLNYGEQGSGISALVNYQSGVQIDRGTDPGKPDALVVFDEQVSHYDPILNVGVGGTFVFKLEDGSLTGIQAASIRAASDSDFVFDLQNSLNVLRVTNSPNYEQNVVDDNDLINLGYLKKYYQPTSKRIEYIDQLTNSIKSRAEAYVDYLGFFINEVERARIDASGLTVDNVNVYSNTITNDTNDLRLTSTTNNVEIDAILILTDQVTEPSMTAGVTKIYSRSQLTAINDTPGRTGIFFTNTVTQAPTELISKNRALLFSMLF